MRAGTIVAAALAFLGAAARADVDLELRSGDVIHASLAAGGAAAVFHATLSADSFLTVGVKSSKKVPVVVRVLEGGAEVASKTGSKVRFDALDLPTTGDVSIEVAAADGASAGAFSLSVAWTLPTTTTATTTRYADDYFPVAFSAVAGAEATFTVGPSAGGATAPFLDSFQNPDDGYVELDGTTATAVIPSTADWTLWVDAGPTDGEVKTTITFKYPKAKRRKVKLLAADVPEEATALAVETASKKGVHVETDDEAAAGAAVDAAKGALKGAGALWIGTTAAFDPPEGATPDVAVVVGLARCSIAKGKTIAVTLPLQGQLGQRRVYRLDADGTITQLEPVHQGAGLLTVATDRGGTFEVASGPGR